MPANRKQQVKEETVKRYSYDRSAEELSLQSIREVGSLRPTIAAGTLQAMTPEKFAATADKILGGQLGCAWSKGGKKTPSDEEIQATRGHQNEGTGRDGRP